MTKIFRLRYEISMLEHSIQNRLTGLRRQNAIRKLESLKKELNDFLENQKK